MFSGLFIYIRKTVNLSFLKLARDFIVQGFGLEVLRRLKIKKHDEISEDADVESSGVFVIILYVKLEILFLDEEF